MNKVIAFILCFIFATPVFANGKVAAIKKGQTALTDEFGLEIVEVEE